MKINVIKHDHKQRLGEIFVFKNYNNPFPESRAMPLKKLFRILPSS